MLNDSIKRSFTLSFASWTSDRKTIDTQLEYQVDIRSAQKIKSPIHLILAHQTAARMKVPNKANTAIYDNLQVRKYLVDIDGVRKPRDAVSNDYASNDFFGENRDPKVFYKEYVGEELPNLFIKYTDEKIIYLMQVIDVRFQVDHSNPKKIQLHEKF